MLFLGKKIGAINESYWGSRTEAEFLARFEGLHPLKLLKAAYKELPKPKKVKEVKIVKESKKEDAGHIPSIGESK